MNWFREKAKRRIKFPDKQTSRAAVFDIRGSYA